MENKSEKTKNSKKEDVRMSTIVYSALTASLGIITAFGVCIYVFGFENSIIRKAEGIIPYPAAIVNNSRSISIGELNENLESIKKFYENQDFSKIDMRVDFTTENGKKRLAIKEKEILNRMIEDQVIEIIAKKKGIKISDDVIGQNLDRKLEEYGKEGNLKENLGRLYGWSIQDFKNKVVKPDIYRQELEDYFTAKNPSVSEAKSLAEKAQKELENKVPFSDVAKKYSEGSTAQDGGELGWFKKDQLITDISEKVFSMKKGERSTILESRLGFHIVELEDKQTENGDDLVNIRQIFTAKKTFFEFLTEEMKKMKFLILVRDYSWNREKSALEFEDADMKKFEKDIFENSQGDASVIF